MTADICAEMLSKILYYKRFFPYYTVCHLRIAYLKLSDYLIHILKVGKTKIKRGTLGNCPFYLEVWGVNKNCWGGSIPI